MTTETTLCESKKFKVSVIKTESQGWAPMYTVQKEPHCTNYNSIEAALAKFSEIVSVAEQQDDKMSIYWVRIEAGVNVECYTVRAVDGFNARVEAHDRFLRDCPSAAEFAEVTGFQKVAT